MKEKYSENLDVPKILLPTTRLPEPFESYTVHALAPDKFDFTVTTKEKVQLVVSYSVVNSKEPAKRIDFPENQQFRVQLQLRPDAEYSVDISLKRGKTLLFNTTMLLPLDAKGRTVVNGLEQNVLYSLPSDSPVPSSALNFVAAATYNENEPNDTMNSARPVWSDLNVEGTMSTSSDNDYFMHVNMNNTSLTLRQKQKINVWLGNISNCSFCDYDLQLLNSSGSVIRASANPSGQNELISDQILSAGTYYSRVFVYGGRYDPLFRYLYRWKATQSWPLEGTSSANITSGFGWRRDPITGEQSFHSGIDIGGNGQIDPAVVAAFDGVVVEKGNIDNRGNYVILQSVVSGQNVQTRYYHMKDNSITVSVVQSVIAGQKLGIMGATGRVTGPHLHFETRIVSGNQATAVDPMQNWFAGW